MRNDRTESFSGHVETTAEGKELLEFEYPSVHPGPR